jgi:ABC-type branched-subunit amino acid transport system permease subunit
LTTIWGLPAHALLVHAIVVLAPLTAVLEILCGFWPAARRRLVWLVLALAAGTTVLTPITTDAGEWLKDQRGANVSPILEEHAERGEWMIYFSVALLVVAVALAVLHWFENRSDKPRMAATVVVVVALVVGVSSIVTVARIGHSGAESVWGGG